MDIQSLLDSLPPGIMEEMRTPFYEVTWAVPCKGGKGGFEFVGGVLNTRTQGMVMNTDELLGTACGFLYYGPVSIVFGGMEMKVEDVVKDSGQILLEVRREDKSKLAPFFDKKQSKKKPSWKHSYLAVISVPLGYLVVTFDDPKLLHRYKMSRDRIGTWEETDILYLESREYGTLTCGSI